MHAAHSSAWHAARVLRPGGRLALADIVTERQIAARGLREHAALVGGQVHDSVRDHDVKRGVVERQFLDPRPAKAGVSVADQSLGLDQLLGCDVNADDAALRADLDSGREHVHP